MATGGHSRDWESPDSKSRHKEKTEGRKCRDFMCYTPWSLVGCGQTSCSLWQRGPKSSQLVLTGATTASANHTSEEEPKPPCVFPRWVGEANRNQVHRCDLLEESNDVLSVLAVARLYAFPVWPCLFYVFFFLLAGYAFKRLLLCFCAHVQMGLFCSPSGFVAFIFLFFRLLGIMRSARFYKFVC